MRFEAGWRVYIPGHEFPHSYSELLKLVEVGAYLSLKPVLIPTKIRGMTRFVGVPSGSIIVPPDSEIDNEFGRGYTLYDDVWIDAKPVGLPEKVDRKCLLSKVVDNMLSAPSSNTGCEIRCYRSMDELNSGLNKKQVALISFGDEFTLSGTLTYFWSTHPILSGLKRTELSCRCWDPGNLGRLGYVSKPLVFVDDVVVAAEITHSRSFIFFCDCIDWTRVLYLRAIMYSC